MAARVWETSGRTVPITVTQAQKQATAAQKVLADHGQALTLTRVANNWTQRPCRLRCSSRPVALSLSPAPEPSDVMYEHLEYGTWQRLARRIATNSGGCLCGGGGGAVRVAVMRGLVSWEAGPP